MNVQRQQKIFITGTDTEVGKTFFTAALIRALQANQQSVIAFKPIAAGCERVDGQWKNEDALTLLAAMDPPHDYSLINPVALAKPIAPHIAAMEEGRSLSVAQMSRQIDMDGRTEQFILVEGAGGWLVPLNQNETFADYVKHMSLDVILVVGLKLGCINHALLTQQSIAAAGLNLCGWVANHVDPAMQNQRDNVQTLKKLLDCPLIAEIPFIVDEQDKASASRYVKLDQLK